MATKIPSPKNLASAAAPCAALAYIQHVALGGTQTWILCLSDQLLIDTPDDRLLVVGDWQAPASELREAFDQRFPASHPLLSRVACERVAGGPPPQQVLLRAKLEFLPGFNGSLTDEQVALIRGRSHVYLLPTAEERPRVSASPEYQEQFLQRDEVLLRPCVVNLDDAERAPEFRRTHAWSGEEQFVQATHRPHLARRRRAAPARPRVVSEQVRSHDVRHVVRELFRAAERLFPHFKLDSRWVWSRSTTRDMILADLRWAVGLYDFVHGRGAHRRHPAFLKLVAFWKRTRARSAKDWRAVDHYGPQFVEWMEQAAAARRRSPREPSLTSLFTPAF